MEKNEELKAEIKRLETNLEKQLMLLEELKKTIGNR